MNGINQKLTAGLVAGFMTLAPSLAFASGESSSSDSGFHALSTLDESSLVTLDALSENDLASIQGEHFKYGRSGHRGRSKNRGDHSGRGNRGNRGNRGRRGNGENFAFVTQINICFYCINVTQSNTSIVVQANNLR